MKTSKPNIVIASRPQRTRSEKAPAAFEGPRIVAAKKLEPKQRPAREIDPEDAFLAQMIRPPNPQTD